IGFETIVQPAAELGYLTGFRGAHTASVLVNADVNTGKVLLAGGGDQTAAIYDPATNSIAATGSMSAQRQHHTATPLPDGTVLVTGGYYFSGNTTVYLATAELYHPNTGTWELLASTMSAARANHTATLLGNGLDVLIAGGQNPTALSSAEVYHIG